MKKVKEVIVVEGRYDKNALSQVVDATIVTLGGFSVFNDREKLAFLRRLADKQGLIVLTDSDGAGVAADIWVESIPFKETRNYVQNVLVYDAIYQHFISRDRQPQFLSGSELRHRY